MLETKTPLTLKGALFRMKSDLIFSLGPNCRNTWNLRNYFGDSRAYPFDWWITPARSMLKMIDPNFRFHIDREDLYLTPTNEHNTVYNYKLNILHHHDFQRQYGQYPGVIFSISCEEIENINAKYSFLFARLHDDIKSSSAPIAIINGVFSGFETCYKGILTNPNLNTFISHCDLAGEVREIFGKKLRLVFITIGQHCFEEYEWGWNIELPDNKKYEGDVDFQEPIHVFSEAYKRLGLVLSPHNGES